MPARVAMRRPSAASAAPGGVASPATARRRVEPASPIDPLPPAALDQIAQYFLALSQPTRLHLLRLLHDGERSVGELAQQVGTSAANASRQLDVLCRHGLLEREPRGNSVYYRIADASVFELCELVCGQLARRLDTWQRQHAVLTGVDRARPATPPAPVRRVRRSARG